MEEQRLAGGRTTGAVKVGETVRRGVGPATPTVHALLRHLETSGFEGAPRALGIDDQGREILTFLEGETIGERMPWPVWVFAEETLFQVGQWLRRFHDATRSFVPPAEAVWAVGPPWQPGMIIAHNDAAPYNAVWRAGALVGFVDFDLAAPSSVELDLAFTALSWVPLHSRLSLGAPGPADPRQRRHRLHLLLDAYGHRGDRAAFGATIAERARLNSAGIRQWAATGNPIFERLLQTAADLDATASEIEALPPDFWVAPQRG